MTKEKKPRKDDAVLGGQSQPPSDAAVLGGSQGVRKKLLNAVRARDQKAYQAACEELATYPNGQVLLKEWATRRCVAVTKGSDGGFFVHRYQLVRHPKFQSLYWHPELDSPFVPDHLRGEKFKDFWQFKEAKNFALQLSTEKEPLLWGVGPWVKADYGWLPAESRLVNWQNLFDGHPLSEDGQVMRQVRKKKLQDLGRLMSGDPDQLVLNKAHITSNHPMYLWFV